MNRILRNTLIIGGLLAAGTSVVLYLKSQFTKLADSCYSIAGGVIHTISLNDVKISLFFKIVNGSDLSVKLSNIDFNIYINNMYVTKISKKEKQVILSNSSQIFKIDFQFNPEDLLRAGISNIIPLLTDKDKLVIGIKGNYDAEMGIVKLNKYKFEDKITLKDLLSPSPNTKKC